jgi:hypothetical protein
VTLPNAEHDAEKCRVEALSTADIRRFETSRHGSVVSATEWGMGSARSVSGSNEDCGVDNYDRTFGFTSDTLRAWGSGGESRTMDGDRRMTEKPTPDRRDISGRWNIVEMDLWDREALDLVAPAFIEFSRDQIGSLGFIVVTGWIDWRTSEVDRFDVEFTWDGEDEEVSKRPHRPFPYVSVPSGCEGAKWRLRGTRPSSRIRHFIGL